MNEIVTSRKEDPEFIEDDVTTDRDGLASNTMDNRDHYKSAERIRGPVLKGQIRSAGQKKDALKPKAIKQIAQTPQVGANNLN